MPDKKKLAPGLTPRSALPEDFLAACLAVKDKRPRNVIDHILEHGIVNTDELRALYGYVQPPRAAMDVKDNGIPLKRLNVKSEETGRTIAAYVFDLSGDLRTQRLGGRRQFSSKFRKSLLAKLGTVDAFTRETMDEGSLQIDHRVPYQVAGDSDVLDDYMLLSGTSQRQKSWACEACANFTTHRLVATCKTCYWASPEGFAHVAMRPERRIDIAWGADEVALYEALVAEAANAGLTLDQLIKQRLAKK